MSTLIKRLVELVMAHEGSYDSVNRNTDGAGLSIGIFQWPQRTGGLGQVLREYQRAEPRLFAQLFGPSWPTLLQQTSARFMGKVEGAFLWEEPWVSRFIRAGQQPVFQAVQDKLAAAGPFMSAAFKGAKLLGFVTERSLAVVLDAAVSQGPEYAVSVARRLRQTYQGKTVSMREVLEAYLHTSIAHFRARTQPPPSRSAHLSWRKVGEEWHKYAGQINLYRNVLKRRGSIITSMALKDELIPSSESALA